MPFSVEQCVLLADVGAILEQWTHPTGPLQRTQALAA